MKGVRRAARQARVRRRHVLFFGGFDPKGASWYHALYRRHAPLQAAVNGLSIEVGARGRDADGNPFWILRGRDAEGEACETRFEVVSWDAVVRRHWPRSGMRVLRQLLGTYLSMLWHGPRQLLKVARHARRSLYALLWPLVLLGGGMLAGTALGAAVAWLAGSLGAPAWLARAVGVAALVAVMAAVLRLEQKLQTSLLARIFAFVCRYAVRGAPELDAAIAHGARRIAAAVGDADCDEVLVVGFSVGSILATRAVGQVLPALQPADGAAALALLTMGNCVPLLGLFPQAAAYRAELASIAASDRLRWVDVSAPGDWASFPMLDPLELCGIEVARRGAGAPQMTSPRFHTLIAPERYAALVADKHAMHMQYLMSTDLPGLYDWFAITAGPLPFAARYAPKRMRAQGAPA